MLVAECGLPGCRETVAAAGEPCVGCIEAFGAYLVPSARSPISAAAIAERDAATRATYVAMLAPATVSVEREWKQNQICWLCEQRHTCTLVNGRWECRHCREDHATEDE